MEQKIIQTCLPVLNGLLAIRCPSLLRLENCFYSTIGKFVSFNVLLRVNWYSTLYSFGTQSAIMPWNVNKHLKNTSSNVHFAVIQVLEIVRDITGLSRRNIFPAKKMHFKSLKSHSCIIHHFFFRGICRSLPLLARAPWPAD